MILENRLYTKEELVDINAKTPLTLLEYFTHHKDLKGEYEEYCNEHNIPVEDENSAKIFMEYRVEQEENYI